MFDILICFCNVSTNSLINHLHVTWEPYDDQQFQHIGLGTMCSEDEDLSVPDAVPVDLFLRG